MVAAALCLGMAACAGGGGQPGGSSEPAPAPSDADAADGGSITGTFGGDAQLEGGCAWVDDGSTRWNVQYPQGYTLTFDPLRLTTPDGQTVRAGDTLTVTGSEQRDVMTTCQIGPVWAATSVRVAD